MNCALTSSAQQINVALHKPVTATSEDKNHPAKNAVDGTITRQSKWMSANGRAPHILEIDLQKYCTISEVNVYTGIPDNEKTADEKIQAAGFFSAKNFRLQYWDDANWTNFPNTEVLENRQTKASFKFSPAVTTFKIRFVCDDGEPISVMEVEALGTEAKNMPAPPNLASDIKKSAGPMTDQSISVKVSKTEVGKSLKYVGYNQGYYFPGSNVSGWLEYAGVNSVRVWATLNSFVPEKDVQVDAALNSVDEFDKRKSELRVNPEHNRFIKWDALNPLYTKMDSSSTNAMVFDYTLSELKRLHIETLLQMNNTDFNDTWGNKWKQWQRYYALAYHAAKQGDVSMFAMQNEPNHVNSGPMKLEQWIAGMQIVSDAIHCAVADVNKQYHKNLNGRFVGPVTAGQNTDWWAAVSKAIRTDYHGKTIDHDLIDIFSTHSYNSPAAGYTTRVNNIRKVITDNHPKGNALPIVFTEIGRWMNAYLIDKEETMDSPSLFTEWAGIYANNMKNNGYGMWAFKFANTSSSTYTEGIKSGHHLTWHGQRIVEDAYRNLAQGKPVRASSDNAAWPAKNITDGIKTDQSMWRSDSTSAPKWLEIDLGKKEAIGSAVVYTGSSYGVFTGTDRIKNFKLEYSDNGKWTEIPGTAVKGFKYVQDYVTFKQAITTDKVRWTSTDPGVLKVREIKLFAKGDGPSETPDFNISGIQRTGEVVHLFAKGFKNEMPLLKTEASVNDAGLDTYTSYNTAQQTYYMWLVQRGAFSYHTKINLGDLQIAAGSPIIAETVSDKYYGEVSGVYQTKTDKSIDITLAPQSVTLLTIPLNAPAQKLIYASADAMVSGGANSTRNYSVAKTLGVALNAAEPAKNEVSYIDFNTNNIASAKRVLLKVNGKVNDDKGAYRLHVYAIPGTGLNAAKLNWKNAPLLDAKEALIHQVGQKAYVAGELAFDAKVQYHQLDVTDIVKNHQAQHITFVFVRETRELGDDNDKGREVQISSMESTLKPQLQVWSAK
ncbi:discoidin domain-containing protein [Mucilaginibacter mali]|uniref:Discoidin domain-containing protein n=2 Tax=Mucilaginibacter mali TaxID=2740462 RepID=A0A7D4TSV3_9SPHI|nr:discoidin domain-containing protein [Mucilaginibacter mali]